jgi:hypothetical protein
MEAGSFRKDALAGGSAQLTPTWLRYQAYARRLREPSLGLHLAVALMVDEPAVLRRVARHRPNFGIGWARPGVRSVRATASLIARSSGASAPGRAQDSQAPSRRLYGHPGGAAEPHLGWAAF